MTVADRATRQVSYANQPMIARNDGSRAGLISAAMPQQTPNRIHAALVGSRWQRIASAMIPTNEHAEMLVSQKIVGIQASGSETAQNAPATVAARESSISLATCIISQMVSRLTTICNPVIASAEANVSLPKTRNIRSEEHTSELQSLRHL